MLLSIIGFLIIVEAYLFLMSLVKDYDYSTIIMQLIALMLSIVILFFYSMKTCDKCEYFKHEDTHGYGICYINDVSIKKNHKVCEYFEMKLCK